MIPLLALLALSGSLRLSEAMVDPSAVGDTHGEFVELQAEGESVDLAGFRLVLPGGDTITLRGPRLEEGGFWVLGHVLDPDNGGFAPDSLVPLGWTLPNTGGRLELLDRAGLLVDSMSWSRPPSGASLERCPRNGWQPSTAPFGAGDRGTPGGPNSCDDTPLRIDGSVVGFRRDGDSLRIAVANRGWEAWTGRLLVVREEEGLADSFRLDLPSGGTVEVAVSPGREFRGRSRWVARLERDGRPVDDSAGLWVVGPGGGVAIAEIQPADPGPEWIELAQELPVALDLSTWTVGDLEPRGRLPAGSILPAGGRLVLSPDCPLLRARAGLQGLACASPTPWPRLSVVEDRITLRDADGHGWDSVSWSRDGGAWPRGRTRERQDLSDFGTVDSWLPSAEEGGTPGWGPRPAEGWTDAAGGGHLFAIAERRMRIGDPQRRLRMEVRAPSEEILRVDLHDMARRRVLRLHEGPSPRDGFLVWDGRDASGGDVRPGVYVVAIQGSRGREAVWRSREWVVVAPR